MVWILGLSKPFRCNKFLQNLCNGPAVLLNCGLFLALFALIRILSYRDREMPKLRYLSNSWPHFLILSLALPAYAQNEFANCHRAAQELNSTKEAMPDPARLSLIDSLVADLRVISTDLRSKDHKVPPSFSKQCYDKKSQAFQALVRLASPSASNSANFNRSLGQYAEITREPDRAFTAYLRASERDPKDYSSRWKAFRNWMSWQESELTRKGTQHFTPADLDAFMAKASEILQPLIDNQNAPIELKTMALETRARTMESLFAATVRAQADWRRVVDLDPKNKQALVKVAMYEFNAKKYTDARKYLALLAPLMPENAQIQSRLIELQLDADEAINALKSARDALKNHPSDSRLHALFAAALVLNSQIDEGRKENSIALKLNPKEPAARKTQSKILEAEGDVHLKSLQPSAALQSFHESFKFDSENVNLRKKMAALLYDHQREAHFEPQNIARKDLDTAVSLVKPLINDPKMDAETLRIWIAAAAKSSRPAEGVPACEKHLADFGSLPGVSLVIDCAKSYKAAKRHDDAKKILKSAIENPKYSSSKSELSQAIVGGY